MCVLGTVAFAVTMRAPRETLKFIAAGSLISAGIERVMSQRTNDFIACLAAMTVLSLYCEAAARKTKTPVTVTLMPSTIPLLPGSSIYYTMFYAINGDTQLTAQYAISTLFAGLGIALGAVISSAIVKIICTVKKS